MKGDDESQAVFVGGVVLAEEMLEAVVKFVSTAEFLVRSFRVGILKDGGIDQRSNEGFVGRANGRGGHFGDNSSADFLDDVTSVAPVGAVSKKEVGERKGNGVRVVEQNGELGIDVVVTEDDLDVKDLREECAGHAGRRCGGSWSGWSHGDDMRLFVWRESKARA